MDISQRQYPQDVIDAIVNELHQDKAALKQCALTATPFVHISRKHLFHSFHLNQAHVAHVFYLHLRRRLAESPHLGAFIRELYVLDCPTFSPGGNLEVTASWMADYGENGIVGLLAMLPNLQYLDLSALFTLDWEILPKTMGRALLDALASIPRLRVSNIKNIPLAQFQNFSGLRSLTLDNVHFDSYGQRTAAAPPHQGYLEFFQFSHNYHIGARTLVRELSLPTSLLSIARLRQLSITGHSAGIFDTAAITIGASAGALEVFTWKMDVMIQTTLGPPFESFHLGMAPRLRHLSLGFIFMSFLLEPEQLQWLVRNLTRSHLAISADLESLDVRIKLWSVLVNSSFQSILENRVWADLDFALAAPRYSKLRRVTFSIEGGWGLGGAPGGAREYLFTELAERMPLLSNKGILFLAV